MLKNEIGIWSRFLDEETYSDAVYQLAFSFRNQG